MRASFVVCTLLVACGAPPAAPAPSRNAHAVDSGSMPDASSLVGTQTQPPLPASGSIDAGPVLERHRRAVGGDAAIARAARMRIRTKSKDVGLESSDVTLIDGRRMRVESKTPVLAADAILVWDGTHLYNRGWNGDVRVQGAADRAHTITRVSLLSLGYLRDATTKIEGLAPIEENGITYDRIAILPDGGSRAELWLRPDGLTRKIIVEKAGRTLARTVDSHGKYGPLVLAKLTKTSDSMRKEVDDEIVESVDLLDAEDPKAFEPPAAKLDVVFPKQRSEVTLPAGLLKGSWLSVTATIAGRTATFLLDTGASMSVFDEDFLKASNIRSAGGVTYANEGAFSGIRFARVPELEIAGMRLGSQVVYVIPLRKSDDFTFPVDGILGYDFWSRFVTTVDYPLGVLTFRRPGSFTPDPADVAIPFELEGTALRIPVSVNGRDAGRFELDTGNGGHCTIHRFEGVQQLIPRGSNPLRFARGIVYGSSTAAAYETSADLGIGPFVYKSAPITVLDPNDPKGRSTSGNGNIGVEFLRGFQATFDYGARTIYLRQKRPLRPASTVGVTGLDMKTTKAGTVVTEVVPGWAAAKAGLQVGDLILSVEGVPSSRGNVGLEEMTPGESRKVMVQRSGKALEVTLVAQPHP